MCQLKMSFILIAAEAWKNLNETCVHRQMSGKILDVVQWNSLNAQIGPQFQINNKMNKSIYRN